MRRNLLDTTPLSAYLLGRPGVIPLVQPWLRRREAATSMLAYGEVAEYLKSQPNYGTHHAQLRRLLRSIVPFSLTYAIMERYAALRRQMRSPHGPGLIGDIDTLVAATALEYDLELVTTDGDF